MQRRPLTPENALVRLESLCARAEHCTFEMATKLRGWGITGYEAEKIIDRLVDNRFVDDERFARSFVRDRYRFSGYGRRKIALGLIAKRIPRDIIDSAMEEIDEDIYFENLRRLIDRKASGLDTSLFDDRNKLYRYGIGRGYESALVAKAIKMYIAENRE